MAHIVDVCPEENCGASFVRFLEGQETLLGFSSPPGHEHDDNCKSREYICSNGHRTLLHLRRSCSKCDWKGKEDCFCHKDLKVDRWPK